MDFGLNFYGTIYSDIKLNGETATTDQERSEFFATHMENTCKTPLGPEFNEEHKINVENHIKTNQYIYEPLNEMPVGNAESLLNENDDLNENKVFKKSTVAFFLLIQVIIY